MRRENVEKVAVCAVVYLLGYALLFFFEKYGASEYLTTFHWRVVTILHDAFPFLGIAMAILLYFEIRLKK